MLFSFPEFPALGKVAYRVAVRQLQCWCTFPQRCVPSPFLLSVSARSIFPLMLWGCLFFLESSSPHHRALHACHEVNPHAGLIQNGMASPTSFSILLWAAAEVSRLPAWRFFFRTNTIIFELPLPHLSLTEKVWDRLKVVSGSGHSHLKSLF